MARGCSTYPKRYDFPSAQHCPQGACETAELSDHTVSSSARAAEAQLAPGAAVDELDAVQAVREDDAAAA